MWSFIFLFSWMVLDEWVVNATIWMHPIYYIKTDFSDVAYSFNQNGHSWCSIIQTIDWITICDWEILIYVISLQMLKLSYCSDLQLIYHIVLCFESSLIWNLINFFYKIKKSDFLWRSMQFYNYKVHLNHHIKSVLCFFFPSVWFGFSFHIFNENSFKFSFLDIDGAVAIGRSESLGQQCAACIRFDAKRELYFTKWTFKCIIFTTIASKCCWNRVHPLQTGPTTTKSKFIYL